MLFFECIYLTNATFNNGAHSVLGILRSPMCAPDQCHHSGSVTNIGDSAFEGCRALTNATIPTNLTSIGNGVFAGCSYLPKVTIPDSVTSLGDGAFGDCYDLSNFTIPGSVTNFAD